MKKVVVLAALLPLALAVPCLHAQSTSFGTYGETSVVSGPGGTPVYQLTSNPADAPNNYSGIYVQFNSAVALSALTTLSADFDVTQGTLGNGAPRFSIGDNSNNEAYVYFGTPVGGGALTDPTPGSWESTGNVVDSTDLIVQNNGFGGGSTGASYETWAQFLSQEGTVDINYITVDEDGGFSSTQTTDINNFNVNGTLYNAPAAAATPEPSSLLLLGTTLCGAAGYVFRRRKAVSL
ncbi:MAG TPA: PEP-CTERM sorting domain-containing protein [Acidobacteriaceae bacterium]|nr:PEP-CTERM sorting domain-containing protein [Acidobacteriaceae bacterium]